MEQKIVKLDVTDRKILSELDKNCRIPSTQLAKKINKSRQATDYRINQLQEKGVITGFKASINPHKMGYKIYKIYLKLRNIPSEKTRLFKYLKNSGNVYWMGECSGSWDLIFAYFCKDDLEFFHLKNELISKFNKIIVAESGQILIDVFQYPKMYFTKELSPPVIFAGKIEENPLDKLDSHILKEVVNNGRISLVELSTKTQSTVQIIQGRLKKMQQLGIIIQYRISTDLNILGLELYKAIIKIDRYTKEDEKRLYEYLSKIPSIQYFIRNLWQLEPEFAVTSYQEYYKIIEDLKNAFPQVIRTIDTVLMITDVWTPGFKNLLSN